MLAVLFLTLLQAPQQQASPIAKVEVTPATADVEVGGKLQFGARALDANGNVVPGVVVNWFDGGGQGDIDSTGMLTAGYQGTMIVTAVASVPGGKATLGQAKVTVKPQPAARVVLDPVATKLVVGTRLTLSGAAFSAQNDRRDDLLSFASSNGAVVRAAPDGRITAVAPGRATVTGSAGKAKATVAFEVVPNTIRKLVLTPDNTTVKTGDVIRFVAKATNAAGKAIDGLAYRWTIAAGEGPAQIDPDGGFVADAPGRYVISAEAGTSHAEAVIVVQPRRAGRGMEVMGRVPIKFSSAEVWAHPSGECVYLSTISDRVYAIDVKDPYKPTIVDSMMVDAQIVNDIMTTEDGKYGVFSREGASNRKNGLKIFDASNPCHPKVIADYTETVTGGVHSSYVYQGRVYLTDDATGSMRVIDIRDPLKPKEVARWQAEQTEAGRYVHDIMVKDGLAYLSYWNDGLIILDVGAGIKGGSPEAPKFVSQFKYNLNEEYARVDQLYGLGYRGTHTAWRAGKYVFVGDEVYASKPAKGLQDGNNLTWGKLHVIDVSDIEHPKKVAWYEPTDGGVHNVWVEGDTLYLGNYHGGARVLDISGELRGDLLRQGREVSWIFTADSMGHRPRATFTWGVVVKNGVMYVPDINSGLWVMKVEPKKETFTP
jgi:plastocyanin